VNTQFYVTRATAVLALASLAFTVATTSVAFGAANLPNSNVSQTGVLTGAGGGGGGQNPGPDDPSSKPRTPGQPGLVSRTDSSIKIKWTDNSSYEQGYNLYRGPDYSGPWTRIAVFGAVPGNTEVMQYTDAGLPRDTRYYYRVGAYNFFGESFSTPQTFATIDGRIDVTRLQIRLRTANVSDAGTDDDVHVAVNDVNVNFGTYLDYGRNDFERGDDFTYELVPDGVSDLSDINQIMIFKTGDDGWCIESLDLLVNGGVVFTQDFGSTSSTCRWLDNENGHENHFVVGRDTLRAHPRWQNLVLPLKTSIPKLELGDLVEGIVGNIIHDDIYLDLPVYIGDADPYWGELHGDRAVVVTGKDSSTVHLSFNLGIGLTVLDDPNVDLSFDVRLTGVCRTPTSPPFIHPIIENIDAKPHFGTLSQIFTLFLINFAKDTIATTIEDNLKAVLPKLERDFPIDIKQIDCVTPSVDADGNVDFIVTQVPKTGGKNITGTFTGGTTTTGTVTGGTSTTGTRSFGGTIGTTTTKTLAK